MKLYQITEKYHNIAELLENPEFAENQDILTALEAVQDTFNNKAVEVVKAIKITEYQIEAIDTEIKRLQAMKKARQNNIDKVKSYLKLNMASTGIDKITCPLFNISYRETADNAVELDEALFLANNLNEELVSVKISPNKNEIKNALKRGENVIGARLVSSQVLTIR